MIEIGPGVFDFGVWPHFKYSCVFAGYHHIVFVDLLTSKKIWVLVEDLLRFVKIRKVLGDINKVRLLIPKSLLLICVGRKVKFFILVLWAFVDKLESQRLINLAALVDFYPPLFSWNHEKYVLLGVGDASWSEFKLLVIWLII